MPYTYKSIIPYDSPLLDVNKPLDVPVCIHCNEPLLDSSQVIVECADSCGHHKSQCVTCLLMEIDDCCIEISSEVAGTVSALLESKVFEKSVPVMEIDFSIRDYLETALGSRIWLNSYTNHANQVTGAVATNNIPEYLKVTLDDQRPCDSTFKPTAIESNVAPENHHEHNTTSSDGHLCIHCDSECPNLNDDLLELYLHEPEAATAHFSAREDLTVDQLPDYVDEDELSTPNSEIEIICNDLG
ncbi:hypothetical protein KCU81_g7702, partial [Aureobasidium melanogenum]|uniref:Uncharacterized protein n=1 Tax=Aureobasidium melanogenum (strain CBS 110374) TaxID=1043003 RepID=A0A074VYE2_AURM1